jgi:hypothetical protein
VFHVVGFTSREGARQLSYHLLQKNYEDYWVPNDTNLPHP